MIKYDKSNFWKSEGGGQDDVYQLIAILISVVAFPMNSRLGFWLAIFFYYTSCVNTVSKITWKYMFTGVSIIMTGFINLYIKQVVPANL